MMTTTATPAAGEGMSRRALLASVPAVAAAAALPAAAASPSPLRALYHEWQAGKTAYNTDDRYTFTSEEGIALYDAVRAIEDQVAECVPQSVEDFALLVLVVHEAADPSDGTGAVAMVKMAHEIAGIPLPARLA